MANKRISYGKDLRPVACQGDTWPLPTPAEGVASRPVGRTPSFIDMRTKESVRYRVTQPNLAFWCAGDDRKVERFIAREVARPAPSDVVLHMISVSTTWITKPNHPGLANLHRINNGQSTD